MITRDNILIAIGRAYAQPRNASKPVDADLASDIAEAVVALASDQKRGATAQPKTHAKVRAQKPSTEGGEALVKLHGRLPGSKLLTCDDCSRRFLSTTGKLNAFA